MMQEAVDKGMLFISCTRVDNKSGWFFQHQQMDVFVKDCERDGSRFNRQGFYFRHMDMDIVSCLDPETGGRFVPAPDYYMAGAY